ncbi:glycosyltransferase family 39 protein [Klenkia soli]|uniref:glycosyltransferase family 39 protein n=1 Tax=Klenkia soli TaxID=1052260 RepID=UPI0013F4D3C8|nr:glycosyltransferase family 39 protein [Klenkia soli]
MGAARSGWGNAYYAAAAQAGSVSWHAFWFGALDPAGGITVDKPPASLWLMGASVRLFGLSPQAVLWPQAVCGVGAVWVLYLTVRRHAGAAAGLLASGILALTPVVTLMARYDNPDALMTLLLVGAAYATTRAVDRDRGGLAWVVVAGGLVGTAFLTKQIQALLVLPALVAVLMWAGPGSVVRRLGRAVAGGAAVVVAAGWWVLLVLSTPVSQRPFIGGTSTSSIWELTVGYNGLGRLNGSGANGTHAASYGRLFGGSADEAGWLLPAALLLLVAAAVVTRHDPRRDPRRAGLLLWGGWLLVVGVVLSSLRGIYHSYYTVELAPAVAAVVAIGGSAVWAARGQVRWANGVLMAVVAGTGVWACALLFVQPAWTVLAVPVVACASVVGVVALALDGRGGFGTATRRLAATAGLVAALAAPATWSVATAASVHQGANVQAGPGVTELGTEAGIVPGTRVPVAVADLVAAGAAGHEWAAVMTGRYAAQVQLASGAPVRMLGGFTGTDPDPSLAAFQDLVAAGRVHYLLVEASSLRSRPDTTAGQITAWAVRGFPQRQYQGWLVVDLTAASLAVAGS